MERSHIISIQHVSLAIYLTFPCWFYFKIFLFILEYWHRKFYIIVTPQTIRLNYEINCYNFCVYIFLSSW